MCFAAALIWLLCLALAIKFMEDLLIELLMFLEPLADVIILLPYLAADTALVLVCSLYI